MIKPTAQQTFGSRLLAIRQMRDLSMDDLAKLSGLSKAAIAKFENGDRNPKGDTIDKLRAALHIPIDYFFKDESLESLLHLEEVSLREGNKVNYEEFIDIKTTIVTRLVNYIEVEKLASSIIEFTNPVEDIVIKSKSDVKEAARKVRKKWKLGECPVQEAVELIETKGVKMFEVQSSVSFEGFSAWADNIPVIVLNSNINETTRLRYTAFHELGHIMLEFGDHIDDATIEKFCDKFASYMLITTESIINELGTSRTRVTLQELIDIKAKYGISILAIIYSAVDARVITWETANSWREQYERLYAENKDTDFGRWYVSDEKPRRFMRLLHSLLANEKITLSKGASLANMKEQEFEQNVNYLDK